MFHSLSPLNHLSREAMDHSNEIDSALWRILRASYLRLLCYGSTRPPEAMDESEQNAALDAHFHAMEADMAAVRAVIDHAVSLAVTDVHTQLHSAPGLDHEMIDEAVQYALSEDP